ncbi:hypothetical protein GCM10022227_38790 [Streptomyces sedi]
MVVMNVTTGDGDWLGRLRPINDYLVALDRQHYERSGVAPLVLALLAVPVAALAVLAGVAMPLTNVEEWAGWLLPGVPVAAVSLWGTWLALRRLTPRHGPLGAEFRAGEDQRAAQLAQLYALPPLGPAWGAALWGRAEELYQRSTSGLTAFAPRDQRELVHGMRTAPFRNFRWTLAGWGVGALTVVGTLGAAAPVLAAPSENAPLLLVVAVVAVGWSLCFRYCFLKWRPAGDRVPRTQKVGWRHELAWLRHQMVASGVLAGWRVPALHTERLWRLTGGGRRSPAATLARLPENALAVRRFYWRYVGAGVVRLAAFFVGCYLIATAVSLAG